MSAISSLWQNSFFFATLPTRGSYHLLNAKGDGLDAAFFRIAGMFTIIPALSLTASLLPEAFAIAILGTFLLAISELIVAIGNLFDKSDNHDYGFAQF